MSEPELVLTGSLQQSEQELQEQMSNVSKQIIEIFRKNQNETLRSKYHEGNGQMAIDIPVEATRTLKSPSEKGGPRK